MPHPLDGLRERISRAERQIEALDKESKRLFQVNPYRVVAAEFDTKSSTYALRVEGGAEPPLIYGIIIGEIVHNLRAALDGLVCQLLLKPGAIQVATVRCGLWKN